MTLFIWLGEASVLGIFAFVVCLQGTLVLLLNSISETERRRRMRKYGEEKKMTLEEYVDFFSSGKSVAFTISYLNQILHMHGFRKLHKSHKKIVGQAVDAVDLLYPSRSTPVKLRSSFLKWLVL